MADLVLSANMDTLLQAANYAAARTTLGLTDLATTTPGTGVATALGVNVGSAGAFVVLNGAGGTPSSIVLTNATGTASGLTAGTASAVAVGGITGLGTGVATALAVNTGSAGAPVLFNGAGGTPSSLTLTNATGLPIGSLADSAAGADRILFWDQSANDWAELTVGSGLSITDTTITATGSGTGDVVGPASSTDNAIVLWDGATGELVQDSVVIVDPITGDMTGVGDITGGALAVSAANPVSNDGAALGTTTLGWSDLHLATGALINVANGNAVITHSSGIFTVSTGDLRVTTAGTNAASCVTVGGTQTLTNKTLTSPTLTGPALGTPSSGTLTNCTGLPASGIAAGVLGGNITLGETTGQIILDAALSADGTWSGIMVVGTAGATVAFGDLMYLAAADSRWELADADAASTSGDVILGMCATVAGSTDGNPVNVLLYGKIRADAAFPAMTIGAPVYVGTTAGDIQTSQPSGTDDVIRVVGFAVTADELMFNPSPHYLTHT